MPTLVTHLMPSPQLATIVSVDSTRGYGPTRLLIGAEFCTGNTLIVMRWLGRKVTTRQLWSN